MIRFAHRLALQLGIWDVPGMLRAMPATTLRAWMAYYDREPFGERVMDMRIGLLIANLAAMFSRKRKRFTAQMFIPWLKERGVPGRRKKSFAEMRAAMTAFTAAHNAKLGIRS